jgi:hypothetical protein
MAYQKKKKKKVKKVKKVRDWTPWLAGMAAASAFGLCPFPDLFIEQEPTPTDEEWDQWLRDVLSA